MADDVTFSYRLPLTYVRITGTRTELTDPFEDKPESDYKSVVTTEVGADLLTHCPVRLSPESLANQKSSWNLTSDGRLTGADVNNAAEPLAAWKAALEAGVSVLSGGALLASAAGPAGWVALAGAAGAAAIGTGLVVNHRAFLFDPQAEGYKGVTKPPDVDDAEPADWNVHPSYAADHPEAAVTLANYRATLSKAASEHAAAARACVLDDDPVNQGVWEERVKSLQRILASCSVGALSAEAAYMAWQASKVSTTSIEYDERLRIDDLPDRNTLEKWAKKPGTGSKWEQLANDLRVAISVELDALPTDNQRRRRLEFEPLSSDEVVHYRQPRSAVVEVWKVEPGARGAYTLTRVEVRRLFVSYPGNETTLSIASPNGTSSAIAAIFDESGALTKVTSDITDRTLQRAREVSAILPDLDAAAESGSNLRKALSPPSLVDRAAEAKAALELGLVPTPDDPLKDLKNQLAEQQLRAQLKLAQQIASSTSVPVIVSVKG
jgi:hypothetical protein